MQCALPTVVALFFAVPLSAQEPAAGDSLDISITDPSKLPMPQVAFTEAPTDVRDYDKYFYFARANTDYVTAFADIKDCDDVSRDPSGSWKSGAYGGILGGLMNEGPEARKTRRINMRRCMASKGYSRYGLPRALWVRFNFEEAIIKKGEEERDAYMRLQARVAANGLPAAKELEP